MDICPDNSTECLLQALLNSSRQILGTLKEGNAEYNWDPATFATTVIIGVLAFLVACVTVFQGLLAAGPGRIRAGKTAIGSWSARSKSRFSWNELAVRSTAITPVIDELDPVGLRDNADVASKERPPFDYLYGSSWASLLHRADGQYNELVWDTKQSNTDYLPTDIAGTPTLARMSTLVFLVATADDYCTFKIRPDGRFVDVNCPNSALSMREHPLLGPVAVYESWGTPRTTLLDQEEGLRLFRHSSLRKHVYDKSRVELSQSVVPWIYRMSIEARKLFSDWCSDSTGSFEEWTDHVPLTMLRKMSFERLCCDFGPELYLTIIISRVPPRPRLVPKARLELREVALQLSQSSFWRMDAQVVKQEACRLFSAIWPHASEHWNWLGHRKHLMKREMDETDVKKYWDFVEWYGHLHWTDPRYPADGDVLNATWKKTHGSSKRDAHINIFDDMLSRKPSKIFTATVNSNYGTGDISLNYTTYKFVTACSDIRALLGRLQDDDDLKITGDPIILSGVAPRRGSRDMTQIVLQALIVHIDIFLSQQDLKDVHCAMLALFRAMSVCANNAPSGKRHSSNQASSVGDAGAADEPAQGVPQLKKDSVPLYQPLPEFALPEEAFSEAYVSPLDSRKGEYRPTDRARISLLVEALRMRGLLHIGVLDLCTDSTALLPGNDDFEDRLVTII